MTRVVRIYRHGGPEELQLEELDIGEPGAAEVRLKIEAIGSNRAEAAFRAGEYPVTPKFPTLIGYEGVGVVEALGAGVQGFGVGERVCVDRQDLPVLTDRSGSSLSRVQPTDRQDRRNAVTGGR